MPLSKRVWRRSVSNILFAPKTFDCTRAVSFIDVFTLLSLADAYATAGKMNLMSTNSEC